MNMDGVAHRRGMRGLILFTVVTAGHLIASILLLLHVFGSGMARFDNGAPASASESLAGWMLTVLTFPLVTGLDRLPPTWFPRLWGYVPFLANASLWGLAAVAVRSRLRTRAAPRRAA